MKIDNLQKYVFILYIVFFPFTTFLGGYSIVNGIGNSYSLIFQVIGLFLVFISLKNNKIQTNNLIRYLFIMIGMLNLISIFMAILLNDKLGFLYGENTYRAIAGNIVYYSQIAIIIYYNYLGAKKVKIAEIKKVLDFLVNFIFVIGYLQIITIVFPKLSRIYDFVNFLGLLRQSEYLINIKRITLTGPEPASCGILLGVLLIPYILSYFLYGKCGFNKIILIVLYLPIIYWTKSSTVYFAVLVDVMVYLFLLIKQRKDKMKIIKRIVFILSVVLIIIGMAKFSNILGDTISNNIKYYLLEKVSNNNNLSTAHRKSTVINNLKILSKYPLTGIGNGNQGFYYNENLPLYAYNSQESMSYYYGEKGMVSGGAFMTSFMSGYGLLGIVLIIIFIIKSVKRLKFVEQDLLGLQYLYIIGGWSFIVQSSIAANIIGDYITLFVLSIPLFIQYQTKKE